MAMKTIASTSPTLPFPTTSAPMIKRKRGSTTTVTCAAPGQGPSWDRHNHHRNLSKGRLVDENMFVLRKRIHEVTRMIEEEEEEPGDAHGMQWERRVVYTGSYDSIICEAVGHLQSWLMRTRPGFAFGVIALIALSLPISTALLLYNLLELLAQALVHHHSIQI